MALVGVVSGVPSVTCLPLGVGGGAHGPGYRPGVRGGRPGRAGRKLASVPWLPGPGRTAGRPPGSWPRCAYARPEPVEALTFSAAAMAVGIVVTFLPLAVAGRDRRRRASLWYSPYGYRRPLAGRRCRRPARAAVPLLGPGVLVAAAGLAMLSLTAVPALVIVGATVFGAGFGVTRTPSLTIMYDRVPESGYSAVGALWNLAYDDAVGVESAASSACWPSGPATRGLRH